MFSWQGFFQKNLHRNNFSKSYGRKNYLKSYYFPERIIDLYKNLFVIPGKNEKSYVAVDEVNEFLNKYLANHVDKSSFDKLEFLTRYYNFIEKADASVEDLLDTRSEREYENKFLSVENIKSMIKAENDSEYKIDVPDCLLLTLLQPLPNQTLEKELTKIQEKLKGKK